MEINESLAAMHAHICGDGNMYVRNEKRSPSSMRTGRSKKRFNRYVLEYTNTCPELLDLMTKYIKDLSPKTYVYRGNKKYRIQARNKELFLAMRKLKYKTGYWTIPREIINNSNLRKAWLRAFFDDEGSVYEYSVLCYNTNKKAMLIIQNMLTLEGLETTMRFRVPTNPKHKICYTIRVRSSSFLKFRKIGFNHTKKKEKYEKLCASRDVHSQWLSANALPQ